MPKAWEDITEVGLPTMQQEHSGEPLTLWETPSAMNECGKHSSQHETKTSFPAGIIHQGP